MSRKGSIGRRLLAGTAAFTGLALAGTLASAADLPSRKAGPVSYVKICDAYGNGFFTMPGSQTCIKIGGYVRFEVQYTPGQKMYNVATGAISQVAGAQDTTGMEVRGQIRLDARTPTEWGTARTYIQMRGTNADGVRKVSVPGNFGTSYSAATPGTSLNMEKAMVQWAGFSFGLIGNEWNNWPSGTVVSWIGDMPAGWSNGVKGLNYTKSLGGGFSVILEIDDRFDAAHDQNTIVTNPLLLGPTTAVSTAASRLNTEFNYLGMLDWQQSWGSSRVGAMFGNNSTTNALFPTGAGSTPLAGVKTYLGWAVNGSLQIKLPMIAPGDEFWVNGAYGVGMLGYVTGDSLNSLTGDSPNRRVIGGVMNNPSNLMATSINSAGLPTAWKQTTSWELQALFTHYWDPKWRTNVELGYTWAGAPAALNPATSTVAGLAALNTQLGSSSVTVLKGNLIFSPIKDMDIGAEVGYGWLRTTIQNPTAAFVNAGLPGLNGSNWITKFRVQRGF